MCTVVNSGSFEWRWEHNRTKIPDNIILIADATRTSILILSDITVMDTGNYSCFVGHSEDTTKNYSRNIMLTIIEGIIIMIQIM